MENLQDLEISVEQSSEINDKQSENEWEVQDANREEQEQDADEKLDEPEPVLEQLKQPVKIDILEHEMVKTVISMIPNWRELTLEQYALISAAFGVAYFSVGVFGIHFNIGLGIIFFSLVFYIKTRLDRARKEGIVNIVSPAMRRLLLRRSLFDVLCDFWYFFPISQYLKAIFGPFFFNISPEEAAQNFNGLNPSFRKLFLTKGLINILPDKTKTFLLPEDLVDVKHDIILDSESTRDSSEINENNSNPSPISCLGQIPYIRQRGSSEFSCPSERQIHGIQGNTDPNNASSDTQLINCGQAVQDEIKREKILQCLQGVIQEKYDKALQYHLSIAVKETKSCLSQDTRVFLMKFLRGSKHVTDKDKKALIKAMFLAGFAVSVQLFFSKRSRQWLKNTLLLSLYLGSTTIGSCCFGLLAKHSYSAYKRKIQSNESTQ